MDDCFLITLCEDRVANDPKTWRGIMRTLDISAIAQRVREECSHCTGPDKQRYLEQRRRPPTTTQ